MAVLKLIKQANIKIFQKLLINQILRKSILLQFIIEPFIFKVKFTNRFTLKVLKT